MAKLLRICRCGTSINGCHSYSISSMLAFLSVAYRATTERWVLPGTSSGSGLPCAGFTRRSAWVCSHWGGFLYWDHESSACMNTTISLAHWQSCGSTMGIFDRNYIASISNLLPLHPTFPPPLPYTITTNIIAKMPLHTLLVRIQLEYIGTKIMPIYFIYRLIFLLKYSILMRQYYK